jgi:hypothetical protein
MWLFLPVLLLLSGQTDPRLTVTPRTGIGPLTLQIRTRTVPRPTDRLLEVVAVEDADPPIVVCRSQVDIRHDGDGRSQWWTATWELPAGAYVIVACVYGTGGRGRCAESAVVVR